MKKIYFLLLSTISLLLVTDVKAQLKLGDQPTSVQKSVILDLQGSNGKQGVWLPRISDTTNVTGIDALNPPDGVMIYHTTSSQVMIRRNGFWSSLQTTQTFTTGTAGTDFTISSSGSTYTFNLPTASAINRGLLSSADWTTFNNKGTVSSVAAGYGINGGTITTTGTHSIDTLSISTRAWRQKGIDSVSGLLNSYIPATRTITINGTSQDLSANRTWNVGTVTSVAAGYGINGGTITTTGTHAVDTLSIATRAWRQKGVDSVVSLINGFIPATRTLNGLALSSNQTFAIGTTGNDINISSAGTTHTFNIPSASTTARGVVTTGAQTFVGSKTFNDVVSAKVNLQAGTAATGTAPLKFTSGTNLAVVENGAVEYDGTNYFATSGGVRYTLAKTLTATATLDFPSTASGGGTSSRNITVTGAAAGDVVMLGIPPSAIEDGCTYYAYVSAANTVTIICTNTNTIFSSALDPASGTFRVSVLKY
jgi:hypothetical protein